MAELSEAEAYALWCERVRLLFGTAWHDTDAWSLLRDQHSDYEDVFRTHDAAATAAATTAAAATQPTPTSSGSVHDGKGDLDKRDATAPQAHADMANTARFPLCFYARMLRGTPASSRAAAMTTSCCGDDEDIAAAAVTRQVAQRLRAHTAKARRRGEYTHCCDRDDKSEDEYDDVLTYRDVRVEAQQAQLHTELTALLLALRRRNAATRDLRTCLADSRVLASLSSPSH